MNQGSPVLTLADLEEEFGPIADGPPAACIWWPALGECEIREPRGDDYLTITEDVVGRMCLLRDPAQATHPVVGLKFCGLGEVFAHPLNVQATIDAVSGNLLLREVLAVLREMAPKPPHRVSFLIWLTEAVLWVGREEHAGRPPVIPRAVWEQALIHPR
jgi:hypothetical protein